MSEKLFLNNTKNILDYVGNAIYSMNKYIEEFNGYIPKIIANDNELKLRTKTDIDLLNFLFAESDEILKNKSTHVLELTLDYITRKHNYLLDILNNASYKKCYISKKLINTITNDLTLITVDSSFSLSESDIKYAYDFKDLMVKTLLENGGYEISNDTECNSKTEIRKLLNKIFDGLSNVIKNAIASFPFYDTSARSCLILKEVIKIIIKCFILFNSIIIE